MLITRLYRIHVETQCASRDNRIFTYSQCNCSSSAQNAAVRQIVYRSGPKVDTHVERLKPKRRETMRSTYRIADDPTYFMTYLR